ncbi:hypothetical protein IP91_00908 [Pseudoduganella lurida]|uniref:histidine kinase n=2 Tax=Pseudoduganella lurida TaxID=1036180 RepID=A0A562RLB5_9BURK|nr:hypothetical protein IP91_00908 [Pseudoduganella lurida]
MPSLTPMTNDVLLPVQEIQAISAVPKILETVAALTGLGFVAVAHVTPTSWTTCAVLDRLDFGLKAGDGLDVATTLCDEVRSCGESIVIDHVQESAQYRDHHTPRMYGFQSYFSIPILRPDGSYFGTLCGLDPKPMPLSSTASVAALELFAELISKQLETERAHAVTQTDLTSERETAELREQFIAVLGHDLRTPLGAVQSGVDLLRRNLPAAQAEGVLARMQRSLARMAGLVDDLVDFARGRMGSGIVLHLRQESCLEQALQQVIEELRQIHPDSPVVAELGQGIALYCDVGRLGQLLSNLVKNAIVHGVPGQPVRVAAASADGVFALSVHNHGDPLAPGVTQQLFKPFWRSPAASPSDGLGLGLYIVAEIARAHGGTMDVSWADGEVGFRFAMPATAAHGGQAG